MFLLAIFIISILVAIGSFAFTGRRKDYAIVSSAVVMILTVAYSLLHFASSYSGGYVSVSNIALSPSTGIYFATAVTGFTDWLLILGTVIIFIAALITRDNRESRTMYSYILIAGAGLFGILISRNFLFFYIFWEVVLIPVYFMIGQFGGKNKDSASMKFFVYTQFGSLFILLAILTLYNFYSLSHSGVLTFQMSALLNTSFINTIPVLWKDFLIFGFLFGFLVKMPSFPVHSWLPDSYESAPFPGTVILAGGLSVMGGIWPVRHITPGIRNIQQHCLIRPYSSRYNQPDILCTYRNVPAEPEEDDGLCQRSCNGICHNRIRSRNTGSGDNQCICLCFSKYLQLQHILFRNT